MFAPKRTPTINGVRPSLTARSRSFNGAFTFAPGSIRNFTSAERPIGPAISLKATNPNCPGHLFRRCAEPETVNSFAPMTRYSDAEP